jgi:hypothetical protein
MSRFAEVPLHGFDLPRRLATALEAVGRTDRVVVWFRTGDGARAAQCKRSPPKHADLRAEDNSALGVAATVVKRQPMDIDKGARRRRRCRPATWRTA